MPVVSVGLPVYNGERFLAEAIESILAQTYTDFELIISDNASTDRTPAICKSYAARDERIIYRRNDTNRGAAYNYNRVAELARGRYFRHASHDDVVLPRNLECCVEVLEADSTVALAYPQMSRIDERGAIIDTFRNSLHLTQPDPVERWIAFHQQLNEGSMCDPVFGLFRMSVLRQTKVLRSVMSADTLLLAEVALRGRIVEIPEVLFHERWHAGTSVNANPTLDDRAAWFDPALRGNILSALPHWQWLAMYLGIVANAPLTPTQRVRCAGVILGPWVIEHKRGLAVEPLGVVARLIGSPQLVQRIDRFVLRA